ncbi:MAG TPA: hypothetical protein VLB27_06685, partial [candidate division Zixibacteria bacterium]|nr:hypothetical protein [candidate division Zixibacteria bacterium]
QRVRQNETTRPHVRWHFPGAQFCCGVVPIGPHMYTSGQDDEMTTAGADRQANENRSNVLGVL